MIKGVIFDYQSPTAKNFGALFTALADCIVDGCAITASGSNITIGTGMMVVGGRALEITSAETISLSGSPTGYVRVICNIDLSGTATTSAFGQAYFTTDTSATLAGFSALTQDDVNMNGTLYQAEVAVFAVSSGVIGTAERKMGGTAVRNLRLIDGVSYGTTLPTAGNPGRVFFKKVSS